MQAWHPKHMPLTALISLVFLFVMTYTHLFFPRKCVFDAAVLFLEKFVTQNADITSLVLFIVVDERIFHAVLTDN